MPPEHQVTVSDTVAVGPDSDGWLNTAEAFIGTDTRNACTPGGWPRDAAPTPYGNSVVQIDDVTASAGRFGQTC